MYPIEMSLSRTIGRVGLGGNYAQISGAALAAMLMAGSASATVTVTITGTGSSDLAGTNGQYTMTMVYNELATSAISQTSGSGFVTKTYAPILSMTFTSGTFTTQLVTGNGVTNSYQVTDYTSSAGSDRISAHIDSNATSSYMQVNFAGPYTTLGSANFVDPAAKNWSSNGMNVSIGQNFYSGTVTSVSSAASAVPEPATWGMMILGFGVVGSAMRRQHKVSVRFG